MVISYYGENCFKIQVGDFVVLVDPPDASSGISTPRFKHEAVLRTLSAFPPAYKPDEGAVQIVGPGEYNVADMDVRGYPVDKESTEEFYKTIYKVTLEGLKLGFLGHISDMPNPDVMDRLEELDVIFVPAGGRPFLEQKTAVKIIRQLQPKIAVPTFYKIPGLKRKADELKIFVEEFNHESPKPQEKLTIKQKDMQGIKPTQLFLLSV